MHALIKVCALMGLGLSYVASPLTYGQDSDHPVRERFIVTGTIESGCTVDFNTNHPMARPFEALRYNSTAPQVVAQVSVSCNFQQDSVNVTYESLNRGLINEFGDVIDYEKSLSGVRGGGLASEGGWTVAQRAGGRPYFFRVSPRSNGMASGRYSDVIVVSVATY